MFLKNASKVLTSLLVKSRLYVRHFPGNKTQPNLCFHDVLIMTLYPFPFSHFIKSLSTLSDYSRIGIDIPTILLFGLLAIQTVNVKESISSLSAQTNFEQPNHYFTWVVDLYNDSISHIYCLNY
jgi:hypothetical protein